MLDKADAIAIFAGAGMSVDSGIAPFRGQNGIWEKNIEMGHKSFNYKELLSHHAFQNHPLEAWSFIYKLQEEFHKKSPHDGYYKLLELVQDKSYFVVTSNIDEYFLRAGFDEHKILECHGAISYMQCMDVLEHEIWLKPEIEVENLKYHHLPKCPNCGGACRPNIAMIGDWFWITTRAKDQQKRFQSWKKNIEELKLNMVTIEIGAGTTIDTIRKAAEDFSKNNTLLLINPFDAETTQSNQFSIVVNALEFFSRV